MTAFHDAIQQVLADSGTPDPEADTSLGDIDPNVGEVDDSSDIDATAELGEELDGDDTDEGDVDGEADLDDEGDDDGETEDGDEDDDPDEGASEVIELDPEMVISIDGVETTVADALELKADYTRKTQALADERKAFDVERAELTEQAEFVAQLEALDAEGGRGAVLAAMAAATEDPAQAVADAVVEMAQAAGVDAELVVFQSIMALASNDLMSDEFAEQLGFTPDVIARVKRQVAEASKLSKLERKVQSIDRERETAEAETQTAAQREAEVERIVARLNSEWGRVVGGNPEVAGMAADDQTALRLELLEFVENAEGDVPLDVAYDALMARKSRGPAAQRAAKAAAAQRSSKAKRTRPSQKPSTAAPAAPAVPANASFAEKVAAASRAALAEKN